jgi:hypothetical protein
LIVPTRPRAGDNVGVRLIYPATVTNFTARFPLAVAAVASLPARSFLIDGEAIVTDAKGLAVLEAEEDWGKKRSSQ